MNYLELIDPLVALATDAGERILAVYATDFDVESKDDASPLTQADLAAHHAIVAGLKELAPDIPIISEEDGLPPYSERSQWHRYWLVDPLDGTREFVNRNGEFTVNIALIVNGKPVIGVVRVPVQATTYLGCEGYGSERRRDNEKPVRIKVAANASTPARVVGSRSHRGASLDAFLDNVGDVDLVPMGVEQAGGSVVTTDGRPMAYNQKEDILNPWFVVIGAADRDWLALLPDRE